MFERFTDSARYALFLGRWIAICERSDRIGSRHLVVGLLWKDGRVRQILQRLGVDPESIYRDVGEPPEMPAVTPQSVMDGPQLPFDRDLKATFPKAVVEADAIGASEIGTEHMLLAIMAASESDTARTLAGAGLTLDALRAFIASEAG